MIAKKKLKGVPIARYEISTGKVYMEYPDGRKVYEKKPEIVVIAGPNGSGESL